MAKGRYGWRIAGFVFKALCGLVIACVIGLLAWRIIDRSITPKAVKAIIPNQKLCEAYEKHGEKLTIRYQEPKNEYTQEDHNYGYFANAGMLFIDEAEQLQFIMRYNKSTLEHVAEDFELSKLPSREENIFDVSLLIMYDLTPENKNDNDGKTPEAVKYVRIFPSDDAFLYQKTLYNYHKYVFDNVIVDNSVLAIYVDIYYENAINYNERTLGTLLIYDCTYPTKEYKLTKNDITAIDDFAK